VCIVRATACERGGVLIEVSTVPDVDHPVHETRRPFTEGQIDDVLQVVSSFLVASVAQTRTEPNSYSGP
jgi:hypothetical protein